MDDQQPWLADLIKSSLDAWFAKLQGPSPRSEYHFRKVSDNLKIKTTQPKTATLLELPTLGVTEPRGEVTDGNHVIETVFHKNTASALIQAGAERGTLLRIIDPIIRITAHVNPPKPLLEIEKCDIVDKQIPAQVNAFSTISLTQESAIAERMAKYNSLKEQNRAAFPTPHSSPQSIASQVPFSPPKHAMATWEVEEEALSQQAFYTQALPTVSPVGLKKPAKLSARPLADGLSALLTTAHAAAPPRLVIASQALDQPSENISHASSVEKDPEKSSPVEMMELGVNSPLSQAASVASKTEEPLNNSHQPTMKPQGAPVTHSAAPAQSFQRWRQHLQGRKYVPRLIARIPREQEEFLESLLKTGNSWQPPLVGKPQRPGEVPLALLEQFCHAADIEAEKLATPENNIQSVTTTIDQLVTPRAQGQGLTEYTSDDEDGSDEVPWSQSPTQRRPRKLSPPKSDRSSPSDSDRSQKLSSSPPILYPKVANLPQSSPPVTIERPRQAVALPSTPDKRDPVMYSPGGSMHHIHVEEDEGAGAGSPPEDLDLGPPSHSSQVNVQSRSSDIETRESTRSSRVGLNNNQFRTVQRLSRSSQLLHDTSAKKIQVKRTPYPGKGANLLSRMRGEQSDNQDPESSFVPATYTSSISSDKAVMPSFRESPKAPPALESSAVRGASTGHNGPEAGDQLQQRRGKTWQPEEFSKPFHKGGLNSSLPAISASSGPRQVHSTPVLSREAGNMQGLEHQEHISGTEQSRATTTAEPKDTTHQPPDQHGSQTSEYASRSAEPANVAAIAPTSTKKRGRNSELSNPQMKRLRPNPQVLTFDPDLVGIHEQTIAERRQIMRGIAKPQAPLRQSSSSSAVEINRGNGLPEAPFNISKQPALPHATINAVRQSSTPITGQSAYSGAWNAQVKIRPADTVSLPFPAPVTDEPVEHLFARYKAAYPDYEGGVNNFKYSYSFIQGVLNGEPNKIHSSLLDDAIFHDYHSYQPYEERTGSSAMHFVKYFNECVDDPSHHKRIIKFGGLERPGSRIQSGSFTSPNLIPRPRLPAGARSIPETAAQPTPSKGDIEVARRAFLERAAPKHKTGATSNANLSQESIESIERWRENAATRGSPELGSSDIDRSRLETSASGNSGLIGANLPSITRNSRLSNRQAPSPAPSHVLTPTVSQTKNQANNTSRPQRKSPPPASSFMKSKPPTTRANAAPPATAISVPSSQISDILPSQKFLVGTNTTFVDITKKYASFYTKQKETRALAMATMAAKAASRDGKVTGMGIDIFAWR